VCAASLDMMFTCLTDYQYLIATYARPPLTS
jgi:hypothetical protein